MGSSFEDLNKINRTVKADYYLNTRFKSYFEICIQINKRKREKAVQLAT